jgi:hypothetical protein
MDRASDYGVGGDERCAVLRKMRRATERGGQSYPLSGPLAQRLLPLIVAKA